MAKGQMLKGGVEVAASSTFAQAWASNQQRFDSQPVFEDIVPPLYRKSVLDLKKALDSDRPQFMIMHQATNQTVSFA